MLTGTITAASQLLNISQPAATRLLLRAEDLLGYKLFERVRGRLIPTREGQILHAESEAVINGLDSLRKLARNLGSTPNGHIKIAAAPATVSQLIPLAITRFRERHADVSFEVETKQYADLVRATITHDADIGIGFDVQPHAGLELTPLFSADFYAAFPIGENARLPGTVKLNLLENYPFIGLQDDDPIGLACSAALRLNDLEPNPVVLVRTNQIALALVAEGVGAAIVDKYTAATHDPKRVVIRKLETGFSVKVNTLRATSVPMPPMIRDFLDTLVDVEKNLTQRLQAQITHHEKAAVT